MQTFADIISLWPSPRDLADDLANTSVITVRSWRRRGIPADRFPEIVSAARARGYRGVSLARLHEMAQPEKRGKAA